MKLFQQWVLKDTAVTPDSKNVNNVNNVKHIENKNNSVFSLELAKEFTSNNEQLAYELFNMLRSELDTYKENISNAVSKNDIEELREQVHKLHGASRCCGTSELKDVSSRIENLIINNINFDIEKETTELLTAIQNLADYEVNTNI